MCRCNTTSNAEDKNPDDHVSNCGKYIAEDCTRFACILAMSLNIVKSVTMLIDTNRR